MIKDLNPNQKHILFHLIPKKKKSFFLKIKDFLVFLWTRLKTKWNKNDKNGVIDYTEEYINSKRY
jgi:hypothetical protein